MGVQCTVSPQTLTHTTGLQGVEVGSVFQSDRVFIPALALLHLPTHELEHSCELLDAAQRVDDLRAVPHDVVVKVLEVYSEDTRFDGIELFDGLECAVEPGFDLGRQSVYARPI